MDDADPRVLDGLRLLRARRWLDAHEAIEAAWLDAVGDRRTALQGMIHLAVSFEHLRRNNPRGALSQWRKARRKVLASGPRAHGIDVEAWCRETERFFADIDLEKRAEATEAAAAPLPAEDTWPVPGG